MAFHRETCRIQSDSAVMGRISWTVKFLILSELLNIISSWMEGARFSRLMIWLNRALVMLSQRAAWVKSLALPSLINSST